MARPVQLAPDHYVLLDQVGQQDIECKHTWLNSTDVVIQKWCDHIQDYIRNGSDAAAIQPGSNVSVPMFPTTDVWCLVHISSETIGVAARMHLEYTPDIGRSFTVPLGLWTPGDGRISMRTVIVDWLLSKCAPEEDFNEPGIKTRCPSSTHGLREARQMQEKVGDKGWKWTCLWNIVMEKACTPCIELSTGIDDGISTGGSDFNNRPLGV